MPDKQVTYVMNLRGQFDSKLRSSNKTAQRFDKSMGRMIGRFATFAAVSGVLVNSIKKIADFEEAVSNLSAITGATGEDLDFLKSKAIEMGKATTKSSIDTVTAFKLIASSKPELLEDAQALAAVTKEAITLSEASGLALPDAAKALTSALNQFGLGAEHSSRAINILAAGSKFAAAEIPDLAMSLKEFGGIAESLGVPLEQAAAAVETVSSKELKGSRAGLQLRNVFLKLGGSTDRNLNPKIVGLSKALENLAPIQDDVTKLTKMFGRQNVLAAQTLIKQRVRLDELTVAMTGTNIAYEQASTNTDNLNSDIKRLSSAWEGFILNLNRGEGEISQVLRRSTQQLTEFIDKLDFANKTREEKDKSSADIAKENLSIRLKGIKDEEVAKRTIIDQILFEKKLRLEESKELDKLIGLRSTAAGALFLGTGDKVLERKTLEEVVASRQAVINELTSLIKDPLKFNKFFKTLAPATSVKKLLGKTGSGASTDVTRITAAAPKVFNITVQKMTGIETLNTSTIKEGIQQTGESVLEQLQIALADTQVVAS